MFSLYKQRTCTTPLNHQHSSYNSPSMKPRRTEMNKRYGPSTIATIPEDSEDEPQMVSKDKDVDSQSQVARKDARSWFDSNMFKGSGKEREKEKEKHRRHRSSNSKHQSKSKSKSVSGKKEPGSPREEKALVPHGRHHRTLSNRHHGSTSEEEEEEEEEDEVREDPRMALAVTRARLNSPSMVSQFTTRTNKSGGSSGSNSTVTQATISKQTALVRRQEPDEPLLSPAVPDAPDVFAYLQPPSVLDMAIGSDSEESEEESEEEEDEDEEEHDAQVHWSRRNSQTALVRQPESQDQNSSSSSTSSSFHGDEDFQSSPHADVDTDRSTSPDSSAKGHDSDHEHHSANDPVSVKIASQMAAAQQRQNRYGDMQQTNVQRVNTNIPYTPSSAMTPRYAPQEQHPISPSDQFPATGYELLASRLSCRNPDIEDGRVIKPMYRKFEALNHRVLLHLQDELSELEEHLRRLDRADTQSRQHERMVIPASRRAAQQAGGELQWHKTDVLGKIGYKLTQYNQALTSFNKTQSLNAPDPDDISTYRAYLATDAPITEEETHFLDPTDDLVSVYSDNHHPPPPRTTSYATSSYSVSSAPSPPPSVSLTPPQNPLPGLATAAAISIVIPIVLFLAIPNFIGRVAVAMVIPAGVLYTLLLSGMVKKEAVMENDAMTSAMIYGGVMVVMAIVI